MDQELRKEYRCPCGKLLFKGRLKEGIVEVKCKGCRKIIRFGKSEELASREYA